MSIYENKIHLAKEFDSTEPACSATPTFMGKVMTNYFYKVTCKRCLDIVQLLQTSEDHIMLTKKVENGQSDRKH